MTTESRYAETKLIYLAYKFLHYRLLCRVMPNLYSTELFRLELEKQVESIEDDIEEVISKFINKVSEKEG